MFGDPMQRTPYPAACDIDHVLKWKKQCLPMELMRRHLSRVSLRSHTLHPLGTFWIPNVTLHASFTLFARHVSHNGVDRMPIPLGAFISDKMYGGRLQSDHSIDDMNCLKFIDVSRGGEDRAGKSWKACTRSPTIACACTDSSLRTWPRCMRS